MTENNESIHPQLLELIAKYFTQSRDDMHPMIRGIMENLPETLVLDLGCGMGSLFSHALLLHGLPQENLVSLDTSASKLSHDVYPRRNKITARCEALPFKDNSFDVVYSKSITLDTPNLDYVRCLEEICRILTPGGIYIADESFDKVPQLAREGIVPRQTPVYQTIIDNEDITDDIGLSPVERIHYFRSEGISEGEFLWYAFSKPDDHHRAA